MSCNGWPRPGAAVDVLAAIPCYAMQRFTPLAFIPIWVRTIWLKTRLPQPLQSRKALSAISRASHNVLQMQSELSPALDFPDPSAILPYEQDLLDSLLQPDPLIRQVLDSMEDP